jgi:putative endonuclease
MNPDQLAYVYIMASSFKRLYIGVTTDLMHRIAEHKSKINPESHTAKYNINKLVYLERFTTITAAIQREKQLKGWLRTRKLDLVISNNPLWEDLSEDWGRPIPPFQESDLKPPTTFRQ